VSDELDLISHYADSHRTLPTRLQNIEGRLDDMGLAGYRRDGSESAEYFPPGFQIQQLFDDFTGSNQIIVTDTVGGVATVDMDTNSWIGRSGDPALGIASGQIGEHGLVFRTGDPPGVSDSIYTGTVPPAGTMRRTRGGLGVESQDLLVPMTPGMEAGEVMAQQQPDLAGGTTALSFDGPYLFSTNSSTTNGNHTFTLPSGETFRPGVQWWFGAPSGQFNTSGTAPDWFFDPGAGQLINNSAATAEMLSGRYLALLMAVGRFSSVDHFVLVQFTPG